MDLINQNKFRNWLIVVLLAINLVTVSIIWMQTTKPNEPQRREQNARMSESVTLMKKTLQLNEEQTKRLENIRTEQLEQLRQFNDSLAATKQQLSEELFADHPDTALASKKAEEIGKLQSKVELLRFKHFSELLALCTAEQKQKLKPIVSEVIGRKPPREEPAKNEKSISREEEEPPRDKKMNETKREMPQNMREDKPAPPSVDEKLAKYSKRLNLTGEQVQKLRSVLSKTTQEGEELRTRKNPQQDEIQVGKDRIRKAEDDALMRILNEDQKKEFIKMQEGRRDR